MVTFLVGRENPREKLDLGQMPSSHGEFTVQLETRTFLQQSIGVTKLLPYAAVLDFYGREISITSGKVRVCVIYPGLTESELVESVTDANIREYARTLYVNAIPAQAIAEAVAYALTQPDSVAVNDITVRPLANQEI